MAKMISFRDEDTANFKLLYLPIELNTKEKRIMQSHLLGETIDDLKVKFNSSFGDMMKAKQDEIAKVEEKNERIVAILAQLQMNEKIIHPELDEDEIPESVIQVCDAEVKAEKFLSAEELTKIEAKRLIAEERQRMQGEDNYRERALLEMMGGNLEDRKAQEDKEEIVKPEWMSKAKEEMSDAQKQLLKEFEKKMAIFKEEQEKHKKALETELRKLQLGISDLMDGYDRRLEEFFQMKLNYDSYIHEKELSIIKQTQFAMTSENDELIEAQLGKRIEELKQEKIESQNEIPEIKKELERCREEYESALKRDKELDKQFKKEFHSNEIYFESLNKLYKKRAGGNAHESDQTEEDLNPYSHADQEHNPPALLPSDMPEGLGLDLWSKLMDFREKKIVTESEIISTSRFFKELQALVQSVFEESDFIKSEMEKVANDLTLFLSHKHASAHDIETLFNLKQGQVEVPQAPIVTNWTDAVLLDRSVVEELNRNVRELGGLKVEALNEMKEYRRGIHALEW